MQFQVSSSNYDSSTSSSPPQCKGCGQECIVVVSHSEKNPDREYYGCPSRPKCKNAFNGWVDGQPSNRGVKRAREEVRSPAPTPELDARLKRIEELVIEVLNYLQPPQ